MGGGIETGGHADSDLPDRKAAPIHDPALDSARWFKRDTNFFDGRPGAYEHRRRQTTAVAFVLGSDLEPTRRGARD